MGDRRVVITGLGVVSPNAIGIADFIIALKEGQSGITHRPELEALDFRSCIAGIPPLPEGMAERYLSPLMLRHFKSSGILYGCIAGMDAWRDAGLEIDPESAIDVDSGIVFGAGLSGSEKYREAIYMTDAGQVRRLASTVVSQTMASGISAYLAGILGVGNQVTTNSSACTTGTEAVMMGYERIAMGKAERMLVGACSDHGAYIWGGFDAMRVTASNSKGDPEKASRPMSATASGFVAGSGAGALLLESLESAKKRGASIYAEVLGGAINSGGQRDGGTMTAPNAKAVQACIVAALEDAGISAQDVDAINGHLTATVKDGLEIENWSKALDRRGADFPYINSLKGMIGHCLAASGAIECVASVLQVKEEFLFPSLNCEDVHPGILALIDQERIVRTTLAIKVDTILKASFGFGDVNGCVVFRRFRE